MREGTLLLKTANYFLHATGQRTEHIDLHVAKLARMLRDNELSVPAFELAVLYTDETNPRDRVLLNDFAEWLCLDVRMQRRIAERCRTAVAA